MGDFNDSTPTCILLQEVDGQWHAGHTAFASLGVGATPRAALLDLTRRHGLDHAIMNHIRETGEQLARDDAIRQAQAGNASSTRSAASRGAAAAKNLRSAQLDAEQAAPNVVPLRSKR